MNPLKLLLCVFHPSILATLGSELRQRPLNMIEIRVRDSHPNNALRQRTWQTACHPLTKHLRIRCFLIRTLQEHERFITPRTRKANV
ncbi:hypothetical protein CEXT_517841 [Caerostris extrusa]|uniref:Secreted protein n=1 Tax=Caerostris extrusa TaxID=172846 RepID=A0AAV4SGX7_CAEEX|nr:hypothetical protein CEXT_517841 [Caerostris extrusa]